MKQFFDDNSFYNLYVGLLFLGAVHLRLVRQPPHDCHKRLIYKWSTGQFRKRKNNMWLRMMWEALALEYHAD